jgi:RluA family pseudouridine synthase
MPNFSVEPNDRVTYAIRAMTPHVVVVDKPSGVATQPGIGNDRNTLMSGLFARFGPQLQKLGKARDFGLLHRLDKDTSGLVVVALTIPAYDRLREAFEQREIKKFYWAVVLERPNADQGVIRKPILEYQGTPTSDRRQRDGGRTLKLAKISSAGKPAVTAYRVLQAAPAASLLECRAVTGRLHQVRVHLAAIRCPILGDEYYGNAAARDNAPRLALHAHRVVLPPCADGESELNVTSPFPKDLRKTLTKFGLSRPDVREGPTEPSQPAEPDDSAP